MLKRIDLRHFKCFETLQLPVCPLTLLSGANASGKSAVMQALVLLHQTMREHEWSLRLMLNGNAIRLGTVADVIDQVHGRSECEIALLDDNMHCNWVFEGEREDMSMLVKHLKIANSKKLSLTHPMLLRNLFPIDVEGALRRLDEGTSRVDSLKQVLASPPLVQRLRGLTYLKAERQGPRVTYPLEDPRDARVVRPGGEHAVSVLYANRDTPVTGPLVDSGAPPTLQRQVEARMARFFPGCELVVKKTPHTSAATLRLRTSTGTDFHRPVHTGSGLTQVFPIVVAALSATLSEKPDGLLLIENPEVHLHPGGQAVDGRVPGRSRFGGGAGHD